MSAEWILHERFLSSHEFSYEKCSEIFPEIFEALFCGSEKIPRKFPPNFPLNSLQISLRKIKKKFTDELLQERREKNFKTAPWNRRPPRKGSIEPSRKFYRIPKRFYRTPFYRNNRKGGTASLHSRTCVKRNVAFGARFKGLSLYFLYQKSGGVRVRFWVRFQAVKVPIFGGFPVENPRRKQLHQSSSKGNFFVRVRFGGVLSTVEGGCPSTVLLLTQLKDQHGKHGPNSTRTPA